KRPTKDPRGGLTPAGRAEFARTEGTHLKPGVKKAVREMSPAETRRKGSWAVRFYGRKSLPPLRDARGNPTRFALTTAAWGEPVPGDSRSRPPHRREGSPADRALQVRAHATLLSVERPSAAHCVGLTACPDSLFR